MKKKNLSYKFYLVRLSSSPIPQLIQYFNSEVGTRAWTSQRTAFDLALIDALIYKGIDVSAIYDGTSINYKNRVDYDSIRKRIVPVE